MLEFTFTFLVMLLAFAGMGMGRLGGCKGSPCRASGDPAAIDDGACPVVDCPFLQNEKLTKKVRSSNG